LKKAGKSIKGTITTLPLYEKLKDTISVEEEEALPEEERADEALIKSLARLEELMVLIEIADRKIKRYGSVKELRSAVNDKKKKGQSP